MYNSYNNTHIINKRILFEERLKMKTVDVMWKEVLKYFKKKTGKDVSEELKKDEIEMKKYNFKVFNNEDREES
jgi:hypothetical protein